MPSRRKSIAMPPFSFVCLRRIRLVFTRRLDNRLASVWLPDLWIHRLVSIYVFVSGHRKTRVSKKEPGDT